MKLKSFYIAISSLILLVSLACIVLEYFKLQKTRRYNWKAKRIPWESDLISSLVEDDPQNLQDFDFRKTVDVIDMKVKKIQIIGRIKATDDLKLQSEVMKISDDMAISNDLGKDDSIKEKTSAESRSHENQIYIKGETEKDFAQIKQRLGQIKSLRGGVTAAPAKQQSFQHLMNNTKGFLNLYIWDNVCNHNLESLKGHILFPSLPAFQKVVNKTEISNLTVQKSGVRIFGFLKPEITGLYRFGISSRGNSELWLSNDTNVFNRRRIAFIGTENKQGLAERNVFDQYPNQTSQELFLTRGNHYFIEILYKHTIGTGRVQVAWKTPQSSMFEVIPGTFLSTPPNLATKGGAKHEDYDEINVQMSIKGLYKMSFMDFIDFENAFPFCDYEPSYYITKKLVRFQVIKSNFHTHSGL